MSNQEKYLDTAEKYHIYQNSEKGIQINDRSTIAKNKIFDVTVKHNPWQMEYHQPHAVAKQYLQYAMNYDRNKTYAVERHEKP